MQEPILNARGLSLGTGKSLDTIRVSSATSHQEASDFKNQIVADKFQSALKCFGSTCDGRYIHHFT